MNERLDPVRADAALVSDPVLGPAVERFGPVALSAPDHSHFAALVRAIVFQQLAGAAASTIHGRLVSAVGGRVTPESVAGTGDDRLRASGLSAAKLAAIRDLTDQVTGGSVTLDRLDDQPDDHVRRRLTQVRGIGPWTADMFLIFQLHRRDVWPTGDLGVRAGYARLAGRDETPTAKELEPLGDPYRPWRTAAAWYCWRAMDGPY